MSKKLKNILPPCVYFKNNAYYFVKRKNGDKNPTWTRIGKTLHEAMAEYVKLVEVPETITKMNHLIDRYMKEVVPTYKSEETQKDKKKAVVYLRAFFGDMLPSDVTQQHVYSYIDNRAKKAPVRANREKSLLSHIFTKAIRWGVISGINPCTHVVRIPEHKRDRYISDKEFTDFLEFTKNKTVRLMAELAYITGQRQRDLLNLQWSDADITSEGLKLSISKTARNGKKAKRVVIEWTDSLVSVIKEVKKIKRNVRGMHLFCTRKGEAYTSSGFQSLWQKAMAKALQADIIKERFTFHDIRHKSATDAEKLYNREYARKLLQHDTEKTTAIYISGAETIKPLK